MNNRRLSGIVIFLAGAAAGGLITHFPVSLAAPSKVASELSQRKFRVFINEVKKNFVFGDEFAGHYSKALILSDGSKRFIELTPMVHNGVQVVELKDGGGTSYMSLNGTATNGTLMIQVRDEAETHRELRSQGWKIP